MSVSQKKTEPDEQLPEPVDVIDGIPDRASRRPRWIFVLLGGIFIAWVLFLIYVRIAGQA